MDRSSIAIVLAVTLLSGCAAPATPTPTSPPAAASAAPPTVAASPAAKPASPVSSPGAVASPSAGPAVTLPLLFSGAPTAGFALQSSAFTAGGTLPAQYGCDAPGGGVSPPLAWSGAPAATKSLAMIEQDPDIPGPNAVSHWLTYNIPSTVTGLDAGAPTTNTLPNGTMQGLNSRRTIGYIAACPPPGAPPHHYTFQLFALDSTVPLQPGATIVDIQQAMLGHIVGQTELIVLFGR